MAWQHPKVQQSHKPSRHRSLGIKCDTVPSPPVAIGWPLIFMLSFSMTPVDCSCAFVLCIDQQILRLFYAGIVIPISVVIWYGVAYRRTVDAVRQLCCGDMQPRMKIQDTYRCEIDARSLYVQCDETVILNRDYSMIHSEFTSDESSHSRPETNINKNIKLKKRRAKLKDTSSKKKETYLNCIDINNRKIVP